jgi:hypothetical protein
MLRGIIEEQSIHLAASQQERNHHLKLANLSFRLNNIATSDNVSFQLIFVYKVLTFIDISSLFQ